MPPKIEEALERTSTLSGRVDSLEKTLSVHGSSLDELREGNKATSTKLDALLARFDAISHPRTSQDYDAITVSSSSDARPSSNTGPGIKHDSTAAAARGAVRGDDASQSPSNNTTTTGLDIHGGRVKFNLKPDELSRFDGRPEECELWLADLEAMLDSEIDPTARPAWEAAIVRVLPRTLRGAARLWYSSLDTEARRNMSTLHGDNGWFRKIRASFSPSSALIRQQARQRIWNPDVESILHYSFAKVALLKAAWKSLSDDDTITDVVDGLPLDIRTVLRVPLLRKQKLEELRDELRIQEAYWRERHNRPLAVPSDGSNAQPITSGGSTFGPLLQPTQPSALSTGAAAFPQQPVPVPRPSSAGATRSGSFRRSRRGKSIREDFDPSRLYYGPHPHTGKRTMAYKVPDSTETMWCDRPCRTCKGEHFDFAHDYCSSNVVHTADVDDEYPVTVDGEDGDEPPPTVLATQLKSKGEGAGPQRRTVLAPDDGRSIHGGPADISPVCCDPPRHLIDAAGCKSASERVAPPLGPEGVLTGGYSTISASGSDGGSGPFSAQMTRGGPQGTYQACPTLDACDQSTADDVSSASRTQHETSHQHPVLHLSQAAWLTQPARLPGTASPTQRPQRAAADVKLARLVETGSGTGYRRHAPTTCQVRFPDSDMLAVSSLVDTGASLSTMDGGLVARLGLQPGGETLSINGIGTQRTLGHVTIPIFIEGKDASGRSVRLHFEQDFHVLPTFAPGVCLGQDWIAGHGAVVDTAQRSARIGEYTFPVLAEVGPARTLSAKICTKRNTVIPAGYHTWVDVDAVALQEGVDYLLEPTFFFDPACQHAVMAVATVIDRDTHRVLVTNFGMDALDLPSRAILGQATAFGPGVTSAEAGVAFPLLPEDGFDDTGAPFDPFVFDEQPRATSTNLEATVDVDGIWRVGTDEHGRPHPGVVSVLRRHHQAFSLDGRPGHVAGAEMTIPVPNPAQLKAEAPRRVSPEKRAAIEREIAQLLEWDVIEDSHSPISAPVHIVRQRDKLRFCVDYRHLNSSTTPDRYPLPRIDDVLESLRGAAWFSSLDAVRGYHQTDVAPGDRWKTAFITHKGLMQYKRVPFGLRNAPAFFQRLMDRLLGPMRWITALVYLDDIVVYTPTLEEHARALDQLLTAAEQVGLRFSPKKCTFAVKELNLLGRKVSGQGLGVMEDRASAVRDLQPPTTLRDLYHVLGLFTYYRQFIPRFAQIAKPLTDLTKGWSYRKQGNTHRLVDADGVPTSAKTTPIIWEPEQQLAFDTIKAAITNPPTLGHPDYDKPFILYTDASKDGFAAAIHQIHVTPADSDVNAACACPMHPTLDPERWRDALRSDPIFGPSVRRLEEGRHHDDEERYLLRDGLLVRRDDGRVCIPRSALIDVLRRAHDDGGHCGFAKTYRAVAADFWHPRLSSLVAAYVRHCLPCQSTRSGRPTGRLDIEHDATRPFEHISVDVILGLPRSRRGRDAVIAVVDTFSKMVLLEPCTSSFTAHDIVTFLQNRIVRLGWRPQRLTSDRDLRIVGEAGRQLGQYLGMAITATPAHHHQANPVERHVQTVDRVLRTMCQSRQGLWDEDILPAAELAINSAPSDATGMTPFDAIYIDSPRLVDSLLSASQPGGVGEWAERFAIARARLLEARDTVRSERARQRRQYDRKHAPLPAVDPGQMVWIRLRDRPVPSAPRGKLAPRKLGPFAVRRVLSPHRVLVDVPPHLRLDGEFDLSQLDLHPTDADPFERDIAAEHDSATAALPPEGPHPAPVSGPSGPSAPATAATAPRRGQRHRTPGPILRDPLASTFAAQHSLVDVPLRRPDDVFRDPRPRAKRAVVAGAPVLLVERPVAFLSRATSSAEAKLTGPELELSCIAWAMTRAQHLLEGSEVTVVTDHAPVPGMLSSRTGQVPYGPIVERARVILRPHLDRLRFVHRPGRCHINVDALSRLPIPSAQPGR